MDLIPNGPGSTGGAGRSLGKSGGPSWDTGNPDNKRDPHAALSGGKAGNPKFQKPAPGLVGCDAGHQQPERSGTPDVVGVAASGRGPSDTRAHLVLPGSARPLALGGTQDYEPPDALAATNLYGLQSIDLGWQEENTAYSSNSKAGKNPDGVPEVGARRADGSGKGFDQSDPEDIGHGEVQKIEPDRQGEDSVGVPQGGSQAKGDSADGK